MTGYTPTPTPLHPLEKFPGATRRVTLPMTGIEVVVRRVDVEAVTSGCVLNVFRTGVLQEVAQEWAKKTADDTSDPATPRRPQPELTPDEALRVQRAIEVGLLRNAVAAPSLEDLMAQYGGTEAQADLGLGPDYSVLLHAVDDLNPAPADVDLTSPVKAGEAERGAARMFPAPERSDAG